MRALALLSLLGLAACTPEDPNSRRVPLVVALTGDVEAGRAVFASTCSTCHGANGEGASGPSLLGHFDHHPREVLADIILTGEGPMPAQPQLSDQAIADVIAFGLTTFQ